MLYKGKILNFLQNLFIHFLGLVLFVTLCNSFFSVAQAESRAPGCKNNPPLRVAVLSAGFQKNSLTFFTQILKKLGEDGFVAENNISHTVDLRSRSAYQKNISDVVKGKCLEFPSELFFVYNWEPIALKNSFDALKTKIANKEIDLIFALGDVATKYITEDDLGIPAICFDTNSTEFLKQLASGKKNIVIVDDSRNIKDDIELFQSTFGYANIGYFRDKNHLYDLYNVYSDVLLLSKEKNFQLKVCEGAFFVPDEESARAEFKRCVTELSNEQISVVFLPEMGNGIDIANFYTQLRPLLSKKIHVISYDSKAQVAAGSLLSTYDPDENTRSAYAVDIIEKLVLNGFNPNAVSDIKTLSVPLSFGVNLKTASIVQWRPSFEVLVAVDDVFHSVKSK